MSQRWMAETWPLVRASLPSAPARVVDLGCGGAGGFVPILVANGYDAIGVDPAAPAEARYQRVEFERAELAGRVDAIVASTSLHHVEDPSSVIERMHGALSSGGRLVVLEWAWEEFDRRTAEWCFARLAPDAETWLHRRRDEWLASGLEWEDFLRAWAERERIHRADELVRLLDEHFERALFARGPYFFADLHETTAADEESAIVAGEINATRIAWVGERC